MERKDRRAMLALIALATDLPLPKAVNWYSDTGLSLDFDSLADGMAWSQHLGGQTATYINNDGFRYLREGSIRWHGWLVQIHANEPAGRGVQLDEVTTASLEAIAGVSEPEQNTGGTR